MLLCCGLFSYLYLLSLCDHEVDNVRIEKGDEAEMGRVGGEEEVSGFKIDDGARVGR